MYPPFAGPGLRKGERTGGQSTLPSIRDFLDELPSIEDFIDTDPAGSMAEETFVGDELPSIESFVVDEELPLGQSGHETAADWFEQPDYDADGWAVTGWQSFDWTGAASLGARAAERDEPISAWDTLDWNTAPLTQQGADSGPEKDVPPSADEVARALDGIARRIRSGELMIDQHSGTPPEAAMAAALAALLRKRV